MRNGRLNSFVFITVMMVASACSSPVETHSNDTALPSVSVNQPAASSIPVVATSTTEPLVISTESPTDAPPTPTLAPTSTIPPGTLTLANETGFGSGFYLSPLGMQLSPDEKRLIVSTTAGIFIFSTDDLSLLLSIHDPVVDSSFHSRPYIRITSDGLRAVTYDDASSNLDGDGAKIRVWDLTTGDLLDEYSVGTYSEILDMQYMTDFIITPDDQQAALLFANGTIYVMNLDDGQIAQKIETYVPLTDRAGKLLFDSAGKYVYYSFSDLTYSTQSIKLDGKSWKEVSRKAGGIAPEYGAISPRLSGSGHDFGYFPGKGNFDTGFIRAVDFTNLSLRFEIPRVGEISAIAFSPDGSKVVMGGTYPEQLEVWNVDSEKGPDEIFPVTSKLWAVAASSRGESLFGITKDGTLYKWLSGQKEPVANRDGFWPIATDVKYSDDRQTLQLFSNGLDDLSAIRGDHNNKNVLMFDPQTFQFVGVYQYPYILRGNNGDSFPNLTAISPDSSLAALYFYNSNNITLVDGVTGKLIRKILSKIEYEYIDFTADGKHLIAYDMPDGPIRILDIESGKVLQELPLKDVSENPKMIRLSGDKATVLVWSTAGDTIRAIQTNTFEPIHDQTIPKSILETGMAFDGTKAAFLTDEGKLLIWDIPTNSLLPEYDLKLKKYKDLKGARLVFSPDNTQLTITTPDGLIRLLDIAP